MEPTRYNWELLDKLLAECGGAAYVLWIDRLRKNINDLQAALLKNYPKCRLGYSYKTNNLPRICKEADRSGLYAEVVSGMEYEMARCLGVPGHRIIFNGPTKSDYELLRAFSDGALVNVDSFSEASQIARLLQNGGEHARIGLRCRLDLPGKRGVSRFGLCESSGELSAAYDLLVKSPRVQIEGLHCQRRMERLIDLSWQYFKNDPPRFLDVGGGLCGPMPESLARQINGPTPSYEEYAHSICKPLVERYGMDGPELIVEPGVGLVGNVVDYLFRVEHVKNVKQRTFAVTSGSSHHIKIVPNHINPPINLYSAPSEACLEEKPMRSDLVGFTCLEHDILVRDYAEPVKTGDIIVAECCGAYSVAISNDFIRPKPPVVELEGSPEGWTMLRPKIGIELLLEQYHW